MSVVFVIVCIGAIFIAAERIFPGRTLPNSTGWYARTIFLNLAQVGVVLLAGMTWNTWFHPLSLLDISQAIPAPAQGILAWFIGTFIFYWWHRARHDIGFLWQSLHQIHHSAARIEILTSFYKHPLEMMSNSIIISFLLYAILGAAPEAALWFNLFAAIGEFFYHSNLKTPHWVGYIMQRPEHHSIHHEFGVHKYNFGDLTLWDRLFGTFKDAETFAARCGFEEGREQKIGEMLLFRDVN
jgi:sterol desaturase/sphingolipid hydroxylase (fatty acid hydroxylase superfamily)